jgi:hypothetical protein
VAHARGPEQKTSGSASITNQADAELSKQAYERIKSLVGERAPISCGDYFAHNSTIESTVQ